MLGIVTLITSLNTTTFSRDLQLIFCGSDNNIRQVKIEYV